MNDKEFPSLKAQLLRARTYLWAETVVFGVQCFVKVTAGTNAIVALLSLSGLVSLPYWSLMAGAAIGAVFMLSVIIMRAPDLCRAAALVDHWTDRPDLAGTCLTLPPGHSASRLVAEQAEAAARRLPSARAWPTLPLRSMTLSVFIILAGVVVMPGARDASATDTAAAMQTDLSKPGVEEDGGTELVQSEPESATVKNSPSEETPSDRPDLLAVLTEEFDAPEVEIGPLGEQREDQVSAGGPADGDGAGLAAASQVAGTTRVDDVVSTDVSLQLTATGSDSGRALEAGGQVPVSAPVQSQAVVVGSRNGVSSTRLASFAHADRALARRYLEKRSGIR